jgi:predicted MFS family arabinose efflux permease
VLGPLIAAAVLFVAFIVAELRVDQPMLPLEFFRNRSFTGAQIGAVAVSASMFALFLYITLYVQNLLGYTPFEAGLIYLPSTMVTFVFSGLTAALMPRFPLRVLLGGGLTILAIGLLMLGGREPNDTWTELLPGFIATGIGVGMINPVVANLALSTVPDEHGGVAAGINDAFRQVALATGVAALGALLLARATDVVQGLLPGTGAEEARLLAEGVSSGALPRDLPAAVADAARQGFVDGLNDILLIGAVIALVGAVLSVWLVRGRDVRAETAAVEAEPVAPAAA